MRRWAAVLLLTPLLVLLGAGPAAAHPLGNFTVNTADRLVVTSGGVRVTHVVDLAEIPTVQLLQARAGVDVDRDGVLSDGELTAYAERECGRSAGLLDLQVDGRPAPLDVVSVAARTTPGQAGLPTTRLECQLLTTSRPRSTVAFTDAVAGERTGWREVTATSVCGRIESSDVPVDSPSGLLAAYPEDLLQSPADVTTASFSLRPGGPCLAAEAGDADGAVEGSGRGLDALSRAATDFLSRPDLTLTFALVSMAAAVVFGAAHALAPGHGKTVMAAYLIGRRGTRRQAVQLGAVVTFTHTASVLLLGALLSLGALAAPERVVPLTEVVAGVLLAAVGVYLLVPAVRRLRRTADHEHGPQDHGHDHNRGPHEHGTQDHDHGPHDHGPHDHGPNGPRPAIPVPSGGGPLAVAERPLVHSHGGRAHTHAAVPDGPLTWRSLTAMGVAGGLVPSPSALLVLLSATLLGRAWFGVVLVVAYGVGMAITLTAAGLLLLRAQAALDRRGWVLGRGRRLGRLLPLTTAGVVVLVGSALVLRGLSG